MLHKQAHLQASLRPEEKLAGLELVRIGKNCDLGLENAAFSRPR